jgi:16S rRNA processing protein RimM
VLVGRVVGVYGVRGWVKIESYTRPPENLLRYREWRLRQGREQVDVRLVNGRSHGRILVAQLAMASGEVCSDRDHAARLVGAGVAVARSQFPPLKPGIYYWADLIGLQVEHLDGRQLGEVTGLMETAAHDVLVVQGERERLIPFVQGAIVQGVDLEQRRIRVDWDPGF